MELATIFFTKLPVHMPASTIFNFPQASKENAT